jgi:hypothetical protein
MAHGLHDEVIIRSTHRGLRYQDGRLTDVLEAGRYELPRRKRGKPQVEIVLVDLREREITIKGQEILTSDKVALRVAALESVADYQDRLYSDVQLAARRSLATMRSASPELTAVVASQQTVRNWAATPRPASNISFDKHVDLSHDN